MKTLLVTLALIFALTGCSSIPENPKMAFGKKCEVTPDGTVVTSHVWVYDGEAVLTASKDNCEELDK